MITKKMKSFVKKREKLVLLGIVILIIFYVGSSTMQSQYDLQDVIGPDDSEVINGDYIELIWIKADATDWNASWDSYQIYISPNGMNFTPILSQPIDLNDLSNKSEIKYVYHVDGYSSGDVIIIKLVVFKAANNNVLLEGMDEVVISVIDDNNPTTSNPTTSNPTTTGNNILEGMNFIVLMAVSGGIVFGMAFIAMLWNKR